jgi:DNA-binding transcriptional ArsR family regulator
MAATWEEMKAYDPHFTSLPRGWRLMIENFRIRVFRAVAHHLNFSRAAEELYLTQPAVTQQLKALEDEIGVPLFDRAGGSIG